MLIDANSIVTSPSSELTPEKVLKLLAESGAIQEGHFIGANGNHLSLYVAKDRATRLTSIASVLCAEIARRFASDDIDVVVAPAVGGISLSQWSAHHISTLRPDRPEVLALYTEKKMESVLKGSNVNEGNPEPVRVSFQWLEAPIVLQDGDELVVVRKSFVLKRGFDKDVEGKRALSVEDILTTGGSAKSTVAAIKAAGGIVVGCAVIGNGGNVQAKDIGVDRLEALTTVTREIYTKEECLSRGLCFRKVPLNYEFGHGRSFLERQLVSGPA